MLRALQVGLAIVSTLPDGGRAARFTSFDRVPPKPPVADSSCIGTTRDGGCVFAFRDRGEDDGADLFFPDGGRRPNEPRLAFHEDAEFVELTFRGGLRRGPQRLRQYLPMFLYPEAAAHRADDRRW